MGWLLSDAWLGNAWVPLLLCGRDRRCARLLGYSCPRASQTILSRLVLDTPLLQTVRRTLIKLSNGRPSLFAYRIADSVIVFAISVPGSVPASGAISFTELKNSLSFPGTEEQSPNENIAKYKNTSSIITATEQNSQKQTKKQLRRKVYIQIEKDYLYWPNIGQCGFKFFKRS